MDRGNAEGGGRSEPICELEIECLEGGLGPAFELARRLLDAAPLHPSAVTKAERGYRLARGEATRPAKAHPIRLARGFAPEQAARAVIAAGLAQLQANEEGVLADGDPEFIHQARIALRRLRSALRMFRQTLGEERARQWRDALGEVARALGEARDWDVFATATFPALARAHGDARMARTLAARAARLRRASHEAARAALRSHAYARVVLDLTAWLVLGEPEAAGRDGLAQFAARTLGKRHKRLLRDAARLPTLEAAERHRVRIDVKRLRYGTDALASLFKSRRVDEYREALDALQDALGEANDAATALVLLPRLEPPEGFAAFARGWLGARSRGDSAYLQALLGRLARVRRFWAG